MNDMSNKLKIAQEVPLDGPSVGSSSETKEFDDEESSTDLSDRSPERTALAEAIRVRNSILAETKALSAALSYARSEVSLQKELVREAEDNLETAKADKTKQIISAALGTKSGPHRTVSEARLQLENRADELQSAIEAEQEIAEKLKVWEQRLAIVGTLENKAQAVIQTDPATAEFLRQFGDLERQYLRAKAFLTEYPSAHPKDKWALVGDTRVDPKEAIAPFKNWERRLLIDPDAELILPDLPG
jgi:ribosomal 50S subunit-associated protein YjgA (DUF615 family)